MFSRLLVCCSLYCLVVADVKHLPRTYLPIALSEIAEKPRDLKYLPPAPQEIVLNPFKVNYLPIGSQLIFQTPNDVSAAVSQDEPNSKNIDVVANDLKLDNSEKLAKAASSDPFYGGFSGAFPYPGFAGQGFPGQGFAGQGFPGQIYSRPVIPHQVFPGHGPMFPSSAGFINPGFAPQVFAGQGFTGSIIPGHGYPFQGFSAQGFPIPGYGNPGFPAQGFPNYPGHFLAAEQLQAEAKEDHAEDKLSVRGLNTDTKYDNTNGGYLYQKPSLAL